MFYSLEIVKNGLKRVLLHPCHPPELLGYPKNARGCQGLPKIGYLGKFCRKIGEPDDKTGC